MTLKSAGEQIVRTAGRAVTTAAFCLAVAASLVVFPGALPWMIAGWLTAFTVCVARKKDGWIPLLAMVAIILAKRVYLFPALVAFLASIAAIALIDLWCKRWQRRDPSRRRQCGFVALAWVGWLAVLWQNQVVANRSEKLVIDLQRPIVCLGDSLTSGIAPDGGYPQELQTRLSVPVVDLGEEGITIAQGKRLLASIAHQRPQAVVIELGGHDFLKSADRATTRANLLALIRQVRSLGAEPILVEIPRGFMTDPYAGLERELAHQQDLQLVADTPIRKLVIWSPFAPPGMWVRNGHFSNDGLHPNAAGNRELAHAVADALQCVFGPAIRLAAH